MTSDNVVHKNNNILGIITTDNKYSQRGSYFGPALQNYFDGDWFPLSRLDMHKWEKQKFWSPNGLTNPFHQTNELFTSNRKTLCNFCA